MLHKILYTKIYEIQFHTRNCILMRYQNITNYEVSYGCGIGGGGGLVVGGGGGGGLVGGGGG